MDSVGRALHVLGRGQTVVNFVPALRLAARRILIVKTRSPSGFSRLAPRMLEDIVC